MVAVVKRIPRESWAILLVLLHLFIAPCATAMVLMPADMDCEHCHTPNGPDACAVASDAAASVIEGVAVDSGRADPPLPAGQYSLVLPAPSAVTAALPFRSRFVATHYSGDPPLYLLLGQLRI